MPKITETREWLRWRSMAEALFGESLKARGCVAEAHAAFLAGTSPRDFRLQARS